jgi:hypothetical protein
MSDAKRLVPHQAPQLPTVRAPSLPELPYSSGQLAFSRRALAVKDAAYTRAAADLLVARTEQARAARALSDARFDLAVALSRWDSLGDVCDHERKKGFLARTSELTTLALELETKEITARIARDAAMVALSAYQPQPPAPPPPSPTPTPPAPPKGLTPAEVRAALQQYPDIKPEAIEPLIMMLTGIMAEKNQ